MEVYILYMEDGTKKKVEVDPTWKVTFGPLVPGMKHGGGSTCLRFYEGKDKPRAVFTGVKEFRVESLNVLEQVTRVKRSRSTRGSKGGHHDVEMEARVTSWVDPDDDSPEEDDAFLGLTFEEDTT
jgi:hypothetical protein